jgi:hypothetical protein
MVEAKPADEDDPAAKQNKVQKFTPADESYNERVRPFGGYILTFDTETFRFRNGQRARFGAWQLRGVPYEERRFANETNRGSRQACLRFGRGDKGRGPATLLQIQDQERGGRQFRRSGKPHPVSCHERGRPQRSDREKD